MSVQKEKILYVAGHLQAVGYNLESILKEKPDDNYCQYRIYWTQEGLILSDSTSDGPAKEHVGFFINFDGSTIVIHRGLSEKEHPNYLYAHLKRSPIDGVEIIGLYRFIHGVCLRSIMPSEAVPKMVRLKDLAQMRLAVIDRLMANGGDLEWITTS